MRSGSGIWNHSALTLCMCVSTVNDELRHCASALRQCNTLKSHYSDTVYVRSNSGSCPPTKCAPVV
ncbi:hypothetical protein AMTR_s00057p00209830 [Amborella trichopoda]|uniref:Uncharacterized protein n=1 Tax=Amborella trichopoda TaxID=13333 RepID=U5CUK5_AMBTC|nr:hypothetical protein AMTR_s00057p00209830 [Amborella trichopoda]